MRMLLPSAVASDSPDRRITYRHRREQCSKLHSVCRRSLLHQPWWVTAPSLSNGSTSHPCWTRVDRDHLAVPCHAQDARVSISSLGWSPSSSHRQHMTRAARPC